MLVGVLSINLRIASSGSLKDRRQVVASIKGKMRSRFNVSVAQLNNNDQWKEATLGFAVVGENKDYLNGQLDIIIRFIEENYAVELGGIEKDILVCDRY